MSFTTPIEIYSVPSETDVLITTTVWLLFPFINLLCTGPGTLWFRTVDEQDLLIYCHRSCLLNCALTLLLLCQWDHIQELLGHPMEKPVVLHRYRNLLLHLHRQNIIVNVSHIHLKIISRHIFVVVGLRWHSSCKISIANFFLEHYPNECLLSSDVCV